MAGSNLMAAILVRERRARRLRVVVLLGALIVLGAVVAGVLVVRRQQAALHPASPHAWDNAILLPDGRVLLIAGTFRNNPPETPEIDEVYDPATKRWHAIAQPDGVPTFVTATLLNDGTVLALGAQGAQAVARRYDPRADRWAAATPPTAARINCTATLIPDGRVLVVGGDIPQADLAAPHLATTELYDPATDRWQPARSLALGRALHTATLLRDGRVLVVGGEGGKKVTPGPDIAELYDPARDSWAATGPVIVPRIRHTATLLRDGTVLLTGGSNPYGDVETGGPNAAQLYDPATNVWTRADQSYTTARRREWATATLLPDGRVVVAGGNNDTIAIYAPGRREWREAGRLAVSRTHQTATLLPDGRILFVGGDFVQKGHPATFEFYTPPGP